jgi:hypothetical protein
LVTSTIPAGINWWHRPSATYALPGLSLPGGRCQIGYVDHTGRRELNLVFVTLLQSFQLVYRYAEVFAKAEEGAPPGTYKNVVSFGPAVIKLSALAVGLPVRVASS